MSRLDPTGSRRSLLRAMAGLSLGMAAWPLVAACDRSQPVRVYRLGLLSNTWWAAEWHNADLATHGLDTLLDEIAYTSDLPHSKPHPSVFLEVASRLKVEPAMCVMVGDRMVDDISGALNVGMRTVWKRNDNPWPKPEGVVPDATIGQLAELPVGIGLDIRHGLDGGGGQCVVVDDPDVLLECSRRNR